MGEAAGGAEVVEKEVERYRDARRLNFWKTRERALLLMIAAAARPKTRPRADLALWESLVEDAEEVSDSTGQIIDFLVAQSGRGAARANLLAALSQRDTPAALVYLYAAATAPRDEEDARGEADELPHYAVEHLYSCLRESLSSDFTATLREHARLLGVSVLPEQYRQWLQERHLELTRSLALDSNFGEEQYARINEVAGTAQSRDLYALLCGPESPAADEELAARLKNLPVKELQVFTEVFNHEWERLDEGPAARRERLLPWLDFFRSGSSRHPLLLLAVGEPPKPAQLPQLVHEIELQAVPASLIEDVSAFFLHRERWEAWGERMRLNESKWLDEINLWPLQHRRLLGLLSRTPPPDPLPPKIAQAVIDFTPTDSHLNRLIKERHVQVESFNSLAEFIWTLALTRQRQDVMARASTIVDLCTHLSKRALPSPRPAENRDVEIFAQLARAAGMAAAWLPDRGQLWDLVARQGWHLMLFLLLFPEERFNVTPRQLGWLVREQQWLSSCLNDRRIDLVRSGAFDLATRPFHSLSYQENRGGWNDGFAQHSIVWAAFRNVPEILLTRGTLTEALLEYSLVTHPQASPEERDDVQAEMCITFVNGYFGGPDFQPALGRVVREFLMPTLRLAWRDAKHLVNAVNDDKYDSQKRHRYSEKWISSHPGGMRLRSRPNTTHLLREVVRLCNSNRLWESMRNCYRR